MRIFTGTRVSSDITLKRSCLITSVILVTMVLFERDTGVSSGFGADTEEFDFDFVEYLGPSWSRALIPMLLAPEDLDGIWHVCKRHGRKYPSPLLVKLHWSRSGWLSFHLSN